jgi:hypothetical protein
LDRIWKNKPFCERPTKRTKQNITPAQATGRLLQWAILIWSAWFMCHCRSAFRRHCQRHS